MTSTDWTAIATVVIPIALATTPWMFMVHAKLAVIAAKVSDLCETIQRANQQQLRLAAAIHRHEARIEALQSRKHSQEDSP